MKTSVREIHVSSRPDSAFFLRLDWRGRGLGCGFQLLLTDGQDAWRGEVSEATVSSEAEELEMQRERYVQDLQGALTGAEGAAAAAASYVFSLTPSPLCTAVTLAYEKVQKDISFRLGSVSLDAVPEPADVVRELLVHSLQRGNTLEQQNQDLEEENQRLRREQRRITDELKRYAGGKEALEAELYSRFVLILNEKKAKIRSLQSAVTQLQETRSSEGEKHRKRGRTGSQEEEEEEEQEGGGGGGGDQYGGSTDEEPEEVQSTPAPSAQPRETPSTPSPLDDSLRDITDVAPTRKRRIRHLGPTEEEVAAAAKKPTATASSSSRRPSHSPAGSSKQQSTSHRSTDAAAARSEVEDLFEDF